MQNNNSFSMICLTIKRICFFALFIAVPAISPLVGIDDASAETITFDEYPVGTAITDQYQNLGVIMSGGLQPPVTKIPVLFGLDDPALFGSPDSTGSITATFVDPDDGAPAEAANVWFYGYFFFNMTNDPSTMTYYDINGAIIGQDIIYPTAGELPPFNWPSKLHKFALTPGRNTGVWINDLTFQIENCVPEVCGDNIDNNCNGIVDEGCECKDEVRTKSSVNMATGALRHSQTLYSTRWAVLPLDLTITYNSAEDDGPLGRGWTHSYNIWIENGNNDSYVYVQPNGKRQALFRSGSRYYKPADSDFPELRVNGNDTLALKQSDTSTYTFDQNGKITGIQDKYGNSISFAYTAGNLIGISDSQGRSLSLSYNTNNRIETITDPNNNIHRFTYESNYLANLTTQTPDSQTLSWTYTYQYGRMHTKTDPMNRTITYDFENRRLSQVTDDEQKTQILDFDRATAVSTIASGTDSSWVYKYDPATGKLSEKTDPEGYKTTYVYGTNTEMVTDAKGNITVYEYDSRKNVVSMTEKSSTDPVGRATRYTYTASNEIETITDPEEHTTAYDYKTVGGERTVTVTDPATHVTSYRYYSDGRIKSITNPKQQITTFTYTYDPATKRTTETATDFLGVSTIRVYDLSGNTVESRDAFDRPTYYEYNSLNQLKTVKDYLQHIVSTYDYWSDGTLKTVTDANGSTTSFKFNYDGKVTEIKDALGNTTTYTYGSGTNCQACSGTGNNLVTATDANNNTTTFLYYKNGWLKSQTDPLQQVTSYFYDGSGFMTDLTDPALTTTSFDKTDLVVTKTDPLGKVSTYVYDKAGRLRTRTDRKGDVIDYSYTPDDVLQTITYPDSSTVTFTYDELGRVTFMSDALGTTSYVYDDWYRNGDIYGKLTVTDPNGFVVVYESDKARRVKNLIYPGNKKVIYGYDTLNRLETIRLEWLNQTTTYYYDSVGRLDFTENFNGTIADYGYDEANRLTSLVNRKPNGSVVASYDYTAPGSLDGEGNRIQAVVNEPLSSTFIEETTEYTYNDKKNQLETAGSSIFDFDWEGQLWYKDSDLFTFDYEHRLASVSGSLFANYSYDGKGNRLKAVRNGQTTYYVYDMNGNVIAEADGNKNITSLYIQGLGLLARVNPANQVYTYHFNAIGSTVAMTDQTKNIVNAYVYEPFGTVLNQTETFSQPFKYVGQYEVMYEPNGFYYMRARYYDPGVGRFISEDPIGFEGGTVNLYEYAHNTPTMESDPLGLYSWADVPRAYYNYCTGTEENDSERNWNSSIESINWGDAESKISNEIKKMTGGSCSNRTIPVNLLITAQTAGPDSEVIGRHNLRVAGTISLKCDCSWTFSGQMSSDQGYDTYNFNPSDRDPSAETQTTLGRKGCKGKPFKIFITGSQALSLSGQASGVPTCCKK